jgi:16S rRNA (guanine1207-N2)-methyltransferase
MAHYFENTPSKKIKEYEFQTILFDERFIFKTAEGMFSKEEVDYGSRILLKYAQITENSDVLDFGCGYGPIGIVVQKRFPTINMTCADVNERAVEYAKVNAKVNKVHITATVSNGFDYFQNLQNLPKEHASTPALFDTILFNPPFSAGKKVCMDLIAQAKLHLKPNGTLQIVAPKKKGGESLAKHMHEVYGNIEVLGKSGGFWVWKAVRLK